MGELFKKKEKKKKGKSKWVRKGSGSSPFPFEMERLQYTVRIFLKMINGQKHATS